MAISDNIKRSPVYIATLDHNISISSISTDSEIQDDEKNTSSKCVQFNLDTDANETVIISNAQVSSVHHSIIEDEDGNSVDIDHKITIEYVKPEKIITTTADTSNLMKRNIVDKKHEKQSSAAKQRKLNDYKIETKEESIVVQDNPNLSKQQIHPNKQITVLENILIAKGTTDEQSKLIPEKSVNLDGSKLKSILKKNVSVNLIFLIICKLVIHQI